MEYRHEGRLQSRRLTFEMSTESVSHASEKVCMNRTTGTWSIIQQLSPSAAGAGFACPSTAAQKQPSKVVDQSRSHFLLNIPLCAEIRHSIPIITHLFHALLSDAEKKKSGVYRLLVFSFFSASFMTFLTIFCSSIRKARTTRSLTQLAQREPP